VTGVGRARPAVEADPVVVPWTDGVAWDRFVAGAADSTLGHRWGWVEVVARTYGHPVFTIAAVRGDRVAGVLPLVLLRSRLFGTSLVSMPYLDCGGLCTDGDRAAERALLTAATELSELHGAPLELRHLTPKDVPLPASLDKVTLTLDLTGGEDAVWKRIRNARRSEVRKARRHGLTVTFAGPEAVDDFYRVWSVRMRDLGSPVHRRAFFTRFVATFDDDARVVLVQDGPAPVGAGIVLRHGNRVVLPFAASLRSHFPKAPNQILYWEAIRHAIATGASVFDMGRSTRGSGTYHAKWEWGAEPVQLYWHGAAPRSGQSRLDRMAWATRLWSRLPLPLTVAVGSRVRGGISR